MSCESKFLNKLTVCNLQVTGKSNIKGEIGSTGSTGPTGPAGPQRNRMLFPYVASAQPSQPPPFTGPLYLEAYGVVDASLLIPSVFAVQNQLIAPNNGVITGLTFFQDGKVDIGIWVNFTLVDTFSVSGTGPAFQVQDGLSVAVTAGDTVAVSVGNVESPAFSTFKISLIFDAEL